MAVGEEHPLLALGDAGGTGGSDVRPVAIATDYFGDRVSFLNLEEDPPTLTSTLNMQRPHNAAITSDGTRALIITDAGVTVLNMTVQPPVACATIVLDSEAAEAVD